MSEKMLSLIIPAYYEQEVLPLCYERVHAVMEGMNRPYEIIFVNDGSRDETLPILRRIAAGDKHVRVFSFSRNFGHQTAVTCGMDKARGDALIIIDADLQDPPELIPQMVALWEQGAEIVYGQRQSRKGETFLKKFTAKCYYRLLSSLSSVSIPLDAGDFRLLDRKVADVFLSMREHSRYLRGMSAWMGFNAVPLPYARDERALGETKYSLRKMLDLALNGITGFSKKPLVLPIYVGAVLGVIDLLGLVALIVMACVSGVAPWLWAFAGLLLLVSAIFIALGFMGEYISRIYEEVQQRPLYIISESIDPDED